MAARYRNIMAGIVPGAVAAFLTYHSEFLFHPDTSFGIRAIKTVGIAMVIPGILAVMTVGIRHSLRLSIVAPVNFLFWFGFGWLCAIFIAKLIKLRRAMTERRQA